MLLNKMFDLANIREINDKLSDLIYKAIEVIYFDMILIKLLRFLLGCLYTANKNVNQPFTRD